MPTQPDVDEGADRLRVPDGGDAAHLLAGDPLDELVPRALDAAPGHVCQHGKSARVDAVRAAAHHEKRHVVNREDQAVGDLSCRAPQFAAAAAAAVGTADGSSVTSPATPFEARVLTTCCTTGCTAAASFALHRDQHPGDHVIVPESLDQQVLLPSFWPNSDQGGPAATRVSPGLRVVLPVADAAVLDDRPFTLTSGQAAPPRHSP